MLFGSSCRCARQQGLTGLVVERVAESISFSFNGKHFPWFHRQSHFLSLAYFEFMLFALEHG